MLNVKAILAPPIFADEEKTRQASLLNIGLWTIIFLMGSYTAIKIGQTAVFTGIWVLFTHYDPSVTSNIALVIMALILRLMMHRGYVRLTGLLFILLSWANVTYQIASLRGIYDTGFTVYFILVLGAGLLLGRWFGVGMAILCSISGLALAYGNANHLISNTPDSPYNIWFDQVLHFGIAAVGIFLATRMTEQALQRAHQNETHLAEVNRELETIRQSLEHRVIERTAELIQAKHEAETAKEKVEQTNQKLAKLNKDKDRFFSIVAHDLKGPFMPLLGHTELLAEMADTLSTQDITSMSQSINRSAKNVYNLLENLLHWSRLQQGHMEYQPEPLDFAAVVEQTINILQEMAKAKGVDLQHRVETGVVVYADKNMLNTIIRNVTSNALKFTPRGGRVTLSAQPRGEFLEVAIVDTGVGMSAEVQAKLFKIDQHITTSGTNQESGTGLGLIICHEMVIKSSGQIWVESTLGQGTTVKFTVKQDNTYSI